MKANESGTLETLAKEWEEDPQDLVCDGCKSETACTYCTDCAIKRCNLEKGLEYCGQCPDFPCEIIQSFNDDKLAHHTGVIRNLQSINEITMETWLRRQAKRWSCAQCGTSFSWYDETCSSCGEELYNSKKEELDIQKHTAD
jgi:hypothetical protein